MEQQLIKEIEHCDFMIKHHSDYLEASQKKKKLFIELQNLILEKEAESQFFHDVDEKTNLILEGDGSYCSLDDDTIFSTASDCLLEDINNLKTEFFDFKTRMDKSIAKINLSILMGM